MLVSFEMNQGGGRLSMPCPARQRDGVAVCAGAIALKLSAEQSHTLVHQDGFVKVPPWPCKRGILGSAAAVLLVPALPIGCWFQLRLSTDNSVEEVVLMRRSSGPGSGCCRECQRICRVPLPSRCPETLTWACDEGLKCHCLL